MADQSAATIGTNQRRRGGGFTLIEVMIVVAILGILATISFSVWFRTRPRSDLSSYGVDVEQVIRNARQQAMTRGRNVSVLFYRRLVTPEGVGRVVVYVEDVDGGFMGGGAAVHFNSFDAFTATPSAPSDRTEITHVISMPRGLTLSAPSMVMTIAYPFNLVPWPVDGCSFCDVGDGRGAIRFDAKGRATFWNTVGLPGAWPNGGSVAVTNDELRSSVIIMVTPFGIVRSFHVG